MALRFLTDEEVAQGAPDSGLAAPSGASAPVAPQDTYSDFYNTAIPKEADNAPAPGSFSERHPVINKVEQGLSFAAPIVGGIAAAAAAAELMPVAAPAALTWGAVEGLGAAGAGIGRVFGDIMDVASGREDYTPQEIGVRALKEAGTNLALSGAFTGLKAGAKFVGPKIVKLAEPITELKAVEKVLDASKAKIKVIGEQTEVARKKVLTALLHQAENKQAAATKAIGQMVEDRESLVTTLVGKFSNIARDAKKSFKEQYDVLEKGKLGKVKIQDEMQDFAKGMNKFLGGITDTSLQSLDATELKKLQDIKYLVTKANFSTAMSEAKPFTVADGIRLKRYMDDIAHPLMDGSKSSKNYVGKDIQEFIGDINRILNKATNGATTKINKAYSEYSSLKGITGMVGQKAENARRAIAGGKYAQRALVTEAEQALRNIPDVAVKRAASGVDYFKNIASQMKRSAENGGSILAAFDDSTAKFLQRSDILRSTGVPALIKDADAMDKEVLKLAQTSVKENRLREHLNAVKSFIQKIDPNIATQFNEKNLYKITKELKDIPSSVFGKADGIAPSAKTSKLIEDAGKLFKEGKETKKVADAAKDRIGELSKKTGWKIDLLAPSLAAGALSHVFGGGLATMVSSSMGMYALAKWSPTLAHLMVQSFDPMVKRAAQIKMTEAERQFFKKILSEAGQRIHENLTQR